MWPILLIMEGGPFSFSGIDIMTTYKVAISADKKNVYLAVGADTFPGGAISLGTFVHDEVTDVAGKAADNHTLFHHVRDILYNSSAAAPATPAAHPDGIYDMQGVKIIRHGPAINAEYLTAAALTVADPGTVTAVIKYQPADVNAANADFTFVSGDVTKATVNAAGVVTGVANGSTTITATHKQTGKVVVIPMTVT